MKRSNWCILVCMLGSAVLVSCGYPGVPIPPALELAKPVTDLRAARKGDRVYLAWTVPAKTTDRQTVRHPGVTRICRSLEVLVADCKNPAAEIPATQFPLPTGSSTRNGALPPKVQANYTDVLSSELQNNPTAEITYAVSVLNESGRSAGLSNQVQVPSAPTLPPPDQFRAEVKKDGVLLSWDCPPAVASSTGIEHKLRIYRREQGKQAATKVSDANLTDVRGLQPAGQLPEFLDQSFEWEKHYDYRATVVTVIRNPAKPRLKSKATTLLQSRFSPTIFFLPPCPPDCKRCSPASVRPHSLTWYGLPIPKPTSPATTSSVTRKMDHR